MKKILFIFRCLLACFLISYLSISFVRYNLNPSLFIERDRLTIVLFTLFGTGIAIFAKSIYDEINN